jgi:2-polyprenyl-3-methyl-5-hydroxy-6-metoxy-1,4-benzoquinol methylase
MTAAKFDDYARNYDALHNQNLAASGEPLEYFSAYKRACLERLGAPSAEPLLDYGCGIGNVTRALAEGFREVHGFDPSAESLKVARERVPSATFHASIEAVPAGYFSSAVLSGVLHHVPRPERPGVLAAVRDKLRPGGRLFVFEHNPLNPVTRHTVRTCPFDDDADLLWPWQARRLLADAGYRAVRLDFIVFFPKPLARLRPLEPRLGWLPLGAQELVIGTR